jgi:transcriptional regulator with XRE-family HTH domain
MAGPPERSNADLTRAAGVKSSSVSAWLSGKTKKMEGTNLLAIAEYLRVNPWWLADGRGKMHAPYSLDPAADGLAANTQAEDTHEFHSEYAKEFLRLFEGLTANQQADFLTRLKEQVESNDMLEAELRERRLKLTSKNSPPLSQIGRPLGKDHAHASSLKKTEKK